MRTPASKSEEKRLDRTVQTCADQTESRAASASVTRNRARLALQMLRNWLGAPKRLDWGGKQQQDAKEDIPLGECQLSVFGSIMTTLNLKDSDELTPENLALIQPLFDQLSLSDQNFFISRDHDICFAHEFIDLNGDVTFAFVQDYVDREKVWEEKLFWSRTLGLENRIDSEVFYAFWKENRVEIENGTLLPSHEVAWENLVV